MTAQSPPDRLLSQQSNIDIDGPSDSVPTAPLTESNVDGSDRSFTESSPRPVMQQRESLELDDGSEEEDLYNIPDAHGTLAPITKDQQHYDSRRGDDDFKKLDFCDELVGREVELQVLWDAFGALGDESNYSGKLESPNTSTGGARAPKQIVFVKGYSGVGKSALIRYFVTEVKNRMKDDASKSDDGGTGSHIIFGSGKFNDSGIPFSAFDEMLQRLIGEFIAANLMERIQTAIATSPEIGTDTEGNRVLTEMWPALGTILDGQWKETLAAGGEPRLERRRSSFNLTNSTVSMNSIKEYTLVMLELFCDTIGRKEPEKLAEQIADHSSGEGTTKHHPSIILFIDDLQWADVPSLELLSYLLSESRPRSILFICAYRSNEVDENHPLQRIIDESTSDRSNNSDPSLVSSNQENDSVCQLELFPLTPISIQKFVAMTLDKETECITGLSEVIYKKTMGNIFYVKQAMEELVRKNALYYDLMCFEWLFTDSKNTELLGEFISDDVVSSVRGKIDILDKKLRKVLVVMSYIPNSTISVEALRQLVASTDLEMKTDELVKLLNIGVEEGMLLLSSESGCHIFAHDRIRQASKEYIEQKERDQMLLQLANVLLTMYKEDQPDTEWAIYVAVDYFNSFEPGTKSDPLVLAGLNLKVAKCARKKGATDKEYVLLEHALSCLKLASVWVEYNTTLEIYNGLIETTKILGKFIESRSYVNEVLSNARNLDDKLLAYRHKITLTHTETRDYANTLKEGIKVLEMYGYEFPAIPSATDCVKEEMKVKMAFHGRPYSCLLDQPLVENPLMELFKDVTQYALVSGNDRLLKIICWKAIRLGLQKGIDHHFHTILVCLGNIVAKEKEIKTAFEIANTAVLLSEMSREDKGNYSYTQLVAYQGVLFQLQSFRSGVDVLLQCYKDLKLDGQVDPALGSALGHILAIFASGITLGPLVESKLILIEKFARKAGMQSFVALFQMQRQFMLNLWKKSDNPTKLSGCAFDEDEFLGGLDSTSRVYSMSLRDTSTFRLILAFVYHDHDCMAKMLDILREYPIADMAVPRLHLRLAFMGLSALYLIQLSKKKNKRFEDIAKSCLAHFAQLTKLGSVNAKPIYHFMLAMKQPSIKTYELAIKSCSDAEFPHMEAMAKEHYGLHLCRGGSAVSVGQDYLVSSYWLYCNWGAHAKTTIMRNEHSCIKTASKKQANSRIEALSTQSGNSSQNDRAERTTRQKKLSFHSFRRKPKSIALKRKSKSSRDFLASS